jgi:type I restriction enzyme S subunit
MRDGWDEVLLRELLVQVKEPVKVEPGREYKLLGVRWYGNGPFIREIVTTETSKATRLFPVQPGDFIYNRLFAWKGSFGLITQKLTGCFVSSEFPLFRVREDRLDAIFLNLIMCQPSKWAQIEIESTGSTSVSRNRWKEDRFLEQVFFLPPIEEQKRIVDVLSSVDAYIDALQQQADTAHLARNAVFHELLSAGGHDWTETTISEVLMVSIGGVWGGDVGTDELDVRVYRQTEFNDNGHLSVPSDAIRSISLNQLKSRRIQPGDILLQKSAGTPTLPGRVVRVPEGIENDSTCSNFLQLIRVDSKKCDPEFLFWELWIRHKSGGAFEFQRGTNIRNLDLNQYFAQSLRLPSFAEQRRIVGIVSSMDDVIQATEKAIAKAKNTRSGLLSDLLSGDHEIPASYDSLMGAA